MYDAVRNKDDPGCNCCYDIVVCIAVVPSVISNYLSSIVLSSLQSFSHGTAAGRYTLTRLVYKAKLHHNCEYLQPRLPQTIGQQWSSNIFIFIYFPHLQQNLVQIWAVCLPKLAGQ